MQNTKSIKQEQLIMFLSFFQRLSKEWIKMIRLFKNGIVKGEWEALQKEILRKAAHFFDIELDPDRKPKKLLKKRNRKKLVKVFLFPFVLVKFILEGLFFKKGPKKIKNKNIYVKT